MAPALRSSKAKGSAGNDSSSSPSSSTSPASTSPPAASSSSSSSYRLWDAFYVLLLLALPLKLLLDLPPDAFGREPANARKYILEQLGLATAGFFGVVHMVNVMGDYCRRKQQTGQDLCKKGTPLGEVPIPESQGLAPGIIYLVIIIACQMLYTQSPESLANYNSSLLSICFMLFLGFVDDVLVRVMSGGRLNRAVCVCMIFLLASALSSHTPPFLPPLGPPLAVQAHPPAHRHPPPPLLLQRLHVRHNS